MKNKLINKYREGTLSPQEELQLEEMIASGDIQLEELEGYQIMFAAIKVEMDTSQELDDRISSLSEGVTLEKPNTNTKGKHNPWMYLLGISMLGLAYFLGTLNDTSGDLPQHFAENVKKAPNQDFATALMNTETTDDKINLVSNKGTIEETDKKTIEVLLFTLNNDKSNNVRLACINALYDYSYLPEVREGFVNSISLQSSPVVVANLADAINASGNKMTKEEFLKLIKKDLPEPIKQTMELTLLSI